MTSLVSQVFLLTTCAIYSYTVLPGTVFSLGILKDYPLNGHESRLKMDDIGAKTPYVTDTRRAPPQTPKGSENEDCLRIECCVVSRHADCSGLKLDKVPQNLSSDILSLNLSNNNIVKLPDQVFARYPMLEYLNISHNNISELGNSSFHNLSQLRSLDLHNNSLEMTKEMFPTDVFLPLESLTFLNINQNNKNLTKTGLKYPDEALSRLVTLKELFMDGLSVFTSEPFGPGFQNMTHLTNLTLAGYVVGNCRMEGLRNNTFTNLAHLEYLSVEDCHIRGNGMEFGTFLPLKQLKDLQISHNENIGIENLEKVFYGVQGAENLTHLHMQDVIMRYSLGICLDSKYPKHFPQHLTYLDFRDHNLEAVDRNVINILPGSLANLTLSGNKFVFGAYLLDLPKLKNLTSIYLNGGSATFRLPYYYPFKDSKNIGNSPSSVCTIYLNGSEDFVLHLPPNLRSLGMSNADLSYILSQMNISEDNSLENITMSRNYFPNLEGPIYGLNSLKYLDLSFSFVTEISDTFFQTLTSLEILILHSNLIGRLFLDEENNKVFSWLTNLKVLDLSFNDIHMLAPDIFSNLTNLSILRLSRNPLLFLHVQISALFNLQLLNLSNTHISTLSPDTQSHISELIRRGRKVQVDLSFCQITSDCYNLDFLNWMTTSGAFDKNFTNYSCSLPDLTEQKILDGYNNMRHVLNRKCVSESVLFFIVGTLTLLMLLFIIGAIVYRFRWNLRYIYYAAYLRYKKLSASDENPFAFDAFICYAEEDQDFVEHTLQKELKDRGLTIYLHRRDFTAGEYITSNILRAVCVSRKTVVVLTRSLIESHWCTYEIEMAKMESVYSGRHFLVFLIMEEIPREKLGRDLLYNIKNNTYQEYPSAPVDAKDMRLWWDKLANDIKS